MGTVIGWIVLGYILKNSLLEIKIVNIHQIIKGGFNDEKVAFRGGLFN